MTISSCAALEPIEPPVYYSSWSCEHGNFPTAPICITLHHGRFEYGFQFRWCKLAITKYEEVINKWLHCLDVKIEDAISKSLQEVQNHISCKIQGECDDKGYFLRVLEIPGRVEFKFPYEITRIISFPSSSPRPLECYISKYNRENGIEQCKIAFRKYEINFNAWGEKLRRLGRRVAQEELEKSVRIFNCRARGEDLCF
jgi:hypothetical protein